MTNNDLLEQAKAHWIALTKTCAPACLDFLCPGSGRIFELGLAYTEARAAQNLEKAFDLLKARVDNLEQKFHALNDGERAAEIRQTLLQIAGEKNEEKISFYAGIIAGNLHHTVYDWDHDLQTEFTSTIAQLSMPELTLLQALYDRKLGEAVKIPEKGKTWLTPNITIDDSILAWIDLLIKKGLVEDASVEQLESRLGWGAPGHGQIKTRSAVRPSIFARSMISYMLKVQAKKY